MEKKKIVQSLKINSPDKYSIAEKYYSIISIINNLDLTTRQIQLLAFTSIHGNISYADFKKEFCKRYDSSLATIGNIICQLKKLKVLIKSGDKVKVNPVIILDFNKDLCLQINIINDSEA